MISVATEGNYNQSQSFLYYLRKYIELIHCLRYLLNLSHIIIWKKIRFTWQNSGKNKTKCNTHIGFSRQQSKAAKDTQIFKIRDILRIKMSTPRVLDIASLS